MNSNTMSIWNTYLKKSKVICKEIFDFFTIQEIAKLELASRSVREKLNVVHLEMYQRVRVVASDFTESWKLLSFIRWYSLHLPLHTPHSLYICVNSYHLKEDLTEYLREPFLEVLAELFKSLNCACLRTVRVNLFK